ncbi:hypothetical protein AB595_06115 [Massilia sp. WF1]|nr:hypothetical protein AM586_08220 [Massilia sp. WG5]KLU37746.1 hypothetical protein AB595_06115 [Massilia sp. WF1]
MGGHKVSDFLMLENHATRQLGQRRIVRLFAATINRTLGMKDVVNVGHFCGRAKVLRYVRA